MKEQLHVLNSMELGALQNEDKPLALSALESGKVIYLPRYAFIPKKDEAALLTERILDGKHKNISYDYSKKRVGGLAKINQQPSLQPLTEAFLSRYAEFAKSLLINLFPRYEQALLWGRTSYRPAEIKGRSSSKRKDDTRLHVDSFPATPVNGLRILRVFSNINPHGKPRVWNLGEPFPEVLKKFVPDIPPYNSFAAKILKLVKATKSLRSPYDHYMLHLHDRMKMNDDYQATVQKERFDFSPNTTWIVFTDQVSHAALGGQYLMEQTFYLPVDAMAAPLSSPLKLLEHEKPGCFC